MTNMFSCLKSLGVFIFNRPAESDEDETRVWNSRYTILVIDDDPSFLSVLRPILLDQGFNVLVSSSGAKGLNMLQYAPKGIHVVLLDYNMPSFDGGDTLQYLRQLSPAVKIVALTGVDHRLLPQTFRAGVDSILTKPLRNSELVQTIRKVLQAASPGSEPVPA
jgi:CheY-like chemotaxis protein